MERNARVYYLNCRRVAFCDGTFYYFQGNPEAITRKVSAGRLDYPFNQFKVWELVHEHAPDDQHGPRLARAAARDLLESLVLIADRPEIAKDRWRLQPAIEGMRSAAFRADLRRAFKPSERRRELAAQALIGSAIVRSFARRAVALSRRLRNAAPR